MDYKINNAELALLLLISENPGVNGYSLRKLVAERGMEAWAGVGSSSIYVVLKKLESREFVASSDDFEKQTKGPRGKVFTVLPHGEAELLAALEKALSQSREHDSRFNIALCGMNLLGANRTVECLHSRTNFLENELHKISNVEKNQLALPLHARLLFGRIKCGIKAEYQWIEQAIETISAEGELNVDHS